MTAEVLSIILKADGSGLTGTLRTSSGEVQRFGAVLDASSGKVSGLGTTSRRTSRDVDALGDSARRNQGHFREWATSLNTVRGTLATLGISLVARELLGAGLAMDRLERSTAAALGSQALAGRELAFVREQAQRLGIYFPTLAEGYAGLAAATRGTNLQGEKTRQIFLGVAEAGRAMNLSQERMQGVLNAVQQIAGKGTVSMEELRQQLGDRLPGAMQIAARSMNMTVAELVKLVSEGKIASEDFLPKFAAELRRSAAAGVELAKNSPAATFERMKTALFDMGVEAARGGGILTALATGASALTSVLNVMVSSGAIAFITKGLLAVAAAGAVFYVGGLLQRGFVVLATSIALTRAPVTAFNVGMAASAAGAQGLTVRMAAASIGARGLAAALAFIQANPIGLAVTAVALLVTWLVSSRAAAKAAADELRVGFQSARQALDDFNNAPSLAATFTLADAKVGETIEKMRSRLADLRKEQEALAEQQARVTARFGNLDAGGGEQLRKLAEESASLTRQLNALELGADNAATTIADMVQRTAGLSSVTPQARRELMGVASEVANGNLLLEDALPKWQAIIERFYGSATAARVSADGIREIIAAASGATEIVGDLQKNIAQLNIRLAGLKGGTEAQIKQRTGYAIMEKGGPQNMTQAELAQIGQAMREEIRLSQQVAAAEKAQADARKATTGAIREQRREQREKIRDDNAAERATLSLNNLIRDQQDLYAGPVQQAMNAYADAVQRIDKVESDLREHNRLNAEAQRLVTQARAESAAAHERNLEIARREEQDIARKTNLVMEAGRAYAEETREMLGSAREREVQRALIEAETAAREQYSKGLRENIDLQAEEIAGIRAAVEEGFDFRKQAVEQQQYAQDVRDSWVGAAVDASRAFGDWFANGFKGAKDFARNLKDIFKRLVSDLVSMLLQNTLVKPFQNWLQQLSGIGSSAGGGMTAQAGGFGDILGNLGSTIVNGIKSVFGFGGSASQGIQSAVQAGTGTAMDGWFSQLQSAGGLFGTGVSQSGGILLPGGGGGSIGAGFGGMSPWMGALGGAAMGWGLGGDTPGKVGGALAGGMVGYSLLGAGGGLAAGAAGMAAGGLYGGVSGMLGAMGPIGWVGLAALAINAISGGKLFGTKYKAESGSQQWSIGETGASGSTSVTEVKQQSFFRGRKWRTTTSALDAESMQSVNELFETLQKTVATAAAELGIAAPDIVGGSFKREFDKNGNLTREFGTIAGKVYNEAQEAFAARLVGENMLAVAKAAGSSAELEQLANAYRATGEELQAFAVLALAVQEDLRNANGIWQAADGDGLMTRIVEYIEGIALAGESLADAYARVQQAITQYGELIGGVRQQIAVHGLNQYQRAQLDVELQYRAMVKQANALAKSLGLSGARAEDLASIEQLRALQMADLNAQYAQQIDLQAQAAAMQNQQWLEDLDLSDLSPLRDDQKLAKAMDLLRTSVAAGDYDRSQNLAQQALNFGRDLYASGADYNALYQQVSELVGSIDPPEQTMEQLQGLTNEQLTTLADMMDTLPQDIAAELAALLVVAPPPATVDPALPPAPVPSPNPPSGGGGGGGGWDGDSPRCVAASMVLDDGSKAGDADAGDVHGTHDPLEGFRRHGIRVRGEAVLQPCVRIVTESGAALVCSRSTPFTDPDAPADLPEYTTLAPDMAGKRVFVQLLGEVIVDTVAAVEDAGALPVIPLDFGGRSFAAGECPDALIFSHNMMKSDVYSPMGTMGVMSPEMASTFGSIDESLLRIAEGVETQNAKLDRIELDSLNGGSRVQWKTGGVMY